MGGKTIISILEMLTVGPLLAIITLVYSIPAEFGEKLDIQSLLIMYMFAMITIPLWFTYIPSMILTPIMMKKICKNELFWRIPIFALVMMSAIFGALIGIFVLSPFLLVEQLDRNDIYSWLLTGTVSGSITFTIVVLIYRVGKAPLIGGAGE